jgi:hypothetical protein
MAAEIPRYAAYPDPRNTSPMSISRTELLQLFRNGKKVGKDLLLVDLRLADHEVGLPDSVSQQTTTKRGKVAPKLTWTMGISRVGPSTDRSISQHKAYIPRSRHYTPSYPPSKLR